MCAISVRTKLSAWMYDTLKRSWRMFFNSVVFFPVATQCTNSSVSVCDNWAILFQIRWLQVLPSAHQIAFIHPVSKQEICITAPVPNEKLWRAITHDLV